MTPTSAMTSLHLSKTTSTIMKVATIVGAITVIAGGYLFVLNNIWVPKPKVLAIDKSEGTATVKVAGKTIEIRGSQPFMIGGDWGVQFGTVSIGGIQSYDRLFLTKKGMIVDYIA